MLLIITKGTVLPPEQRPVRTDLETEMVPPINYACWLQDNDAELKERGHKVLLQCREFKITVYHGEHETDVKANPTEVFSISLFTLSLFCLFVCLFVCF